MTNSNYFEKLAALPPESEHLHSIWSIRMAGHNIKILPPEIRYLKNLQKLELKESILTNLPSEIGQLQNLQRLILTENLVIALPPEIGRLQNLQYLNLSHNRLTELPPEIGQLKNLERLMLLGRSTRHHRPIPENNLIQDLSALLNHPNQNLRVDMFGVAIPRRYWTHPNQWQTEWLLTEKNAELRKMLIERIGYERICQELQTAELDQWREYSLLKIDAKVDVEPIHLLKMHCPSTTHIHVLRVPPTLTSAREAIRWANWDIDPEAFAAET